MPHVQRQRTPRRIQEVMRLIEICREKGHWKRVEKLCRGVLRVDSSDARFGQLLGVALFRQRRPAEALECLRQWTQKSPEHWQIWNDLGTVARALHLWGQAIDAFQRSLSLQPSQHGAHHNLGNLYLAMDQVEQAAEHYRCAIERNPNEIRTWLSLAALHREREEWRDCEQSLERAEKLQPSSPAAQLEWGLLHIQRQDWEKASAALNRSVQLQPNVNAYLQLGRLAGLRGDLGLAKRHYQAALTRGRQNPFTLLHVAYELLALGEWELGWRAYEGRFHPDVATMPPRPYSFPRWDGNLHRTRKLLIWGEQGVGDEVFFLPLVRELREVGLECILECEPRLTSLFARSLPGVKVVDRAQTVEPRIYESAVDAQLPAGSLARILRPSLSHCSKNVPSVLTPDPRLVELFCRQDQGKPLGYRVGISWRSGNPTNGHRRSAPLEHWQPLFAIPGITWHSLQHGSVIEDLEIVERRIGVEVHQEPLLDSGRNLEALAARIASLDLVISIDNSTVHFAGGLGAPVWNLLSTSADWRWLQDRVDSPWYPSMRLFRQRRRGDWRELMDRVAEELKRKVQRFTSLAAA